MALTKQQRYYRKWYRNNRQRQLALVARRKRQLVQWLANYRAGRKCKRCPECDPACLDFHHRNPKHKLFSISASSVSSIGSKARILAEIAKCDVLCANCHRKHHARKRKR